MRVFVTGATGFVGTAVLDELRAGGHEVLGLARSDEGEAKLKAQGVEAARGDLNDPEALAALAREADAVVHLGFIHDFSKFEENMATDRRVVEAILKALDGTGKAFIGTSGVAMLAPGRVATEDGEPPAWGRHDTDRFTVAAADRGVRAEVVRLAPTTHGRGDHGFLPMLIGVAREKGLAAYVGDGANRWPAVHRSDAAHLYRLVLEKAEPGRRWHAVAEEGVPMRRIAETIGEGLGLPVRSLTPEEAQAHFGWMAMFAGTDMPASSAITRDTLGWSPQGPDLLTDLREGGYFD